MTVSEPLDVEKLQKENLRPLWLAPVNTVTKNKFPANLCAGLFRRSGAIKPSARACSKWGRPFRLRRRNAGSLCW